MQHKEIFQGYRDVMAASILPCLTISGAEHVAREREICQGFFVPSWFQGAAGSWCNLDHPLRLLQFGQGTSMSPGESQDLGSTKVS